MPADFNLIGDVSINPQSVSAVERTLQRFRNIPINFRIDSAPLGRITALAGDFTRSMEAAQARTISFGAVTSVIYGVVRSVEEMVKSFVDVEKKLTDIKVILQPTTAEFQKFSGTLFSIARDTGQSFESVSEAALNLSRQGLKTAEVLQRVKDAMILSRQSGLDATESTNALTAAINTFNREALTSTEIINKLANVDTKFAVSQRDSIEAIKRAGAAAQDAGVSFNKLVAFTAELQQTTARGGAVIGNALKSIFTRTERSTTLDALEQFNIQTRDLQGNVLSADRILQNLANTYKNLSQNERTAVSERVAGIQQINLLKALLNDLGSSYSIYGRAVAAAGQQTNTAIDRNKLLNQTLAAQLNATKQNATEFSSVAGKLLFEPAIKTGSNILDTVFSPFKQQTDQSKGTGTKIGEGILKGIGEALAGPGLVIGLSVLANVLKGLGGYTKNVLIDYASLTGRSKEQANIQGAINQILGSGNRYYSERLARATSIKEEEAAIRDIMLQINGLQIQNSSRFFGAASNLAGANVKVNKNANNFTVPNAAGGFLPIQQEQNDINNRVGGANPGAKPKVIPNFNFGNGRRGTVVANTDEYLVPHFGNGSAIFNENMVRNFGLPAGAQKINEAGGYVPDLHEPSHGVHHSRLNLDSYKRTYAGGYAPGIPNFFNKYSKDEINYSGALIDKNYRYIYSEGDTSLQSRLAARKKGFEILSATDANHISQNSEILKGHQLKVVDPTANFGSGGGIFNILSAKSFAGDKLLETKLSSSLPKSLGIREFLNSQNSTGRNVGKFFNSVKQNFGENFFIKGREGAGGDKVYTQETAQHFINKLTPEFKDDYFIQQGVPNVSGREYRVTAGGAGNESRLLGGASLRGVEGKLIHDFFENKQSKGNLLSRTGGGDLNTLYRFGRRKISDILGKFIAEKQGLRAFNDLPENVRAGGVAGLDVAETGNRGFKRFGQAAAELFGLGKNIKGGGAIELNFSQSEENANKFGGQPGYSASLDRSDILIKAAKSLIDNNGGFASGYVPNYNNLSKAIQREHGAGIPYDKIKISEAAELAGPGNPLGLGVSNTRDEPGGLYQGIERARKEGRNPKNYGAARGLIPNFADLNITPSQLSLYGSPQGQNLLGANNPAKKTILEFIKNGLQLSKSELTQPINQFNQTIVNAVADALKLDPQRLTAAQQAGANKIANQFSLIHRDEIRAAGAEQRGQKKQQEEDVELQKEKARHGIQSQKLIDEFSKDIVGKNKVLSGGKYINNLSNNLFSSSGFNSLDEEHQNYVRNQLGNISLQQGQERASRRQSFAIGASLAIPVLTNGLTAAFGSDNSRGGRRVNAVGEALGTGTAAAGAFGFSPAGLAIGGLTAAFIGLSGWVNASRKSLQDYSKELEDSKGKIENNKNNIGTGFQAQEQLQEILQRGGSRSEINNVSQQIQQVIRSIDDPKLRNQFVNAQTDDQKRKLLLDVSAQEVKISASKGLQAEVESIFEKQRTLGFDSKAKNLTLTADQKDSISTLITNSLPLSLNDKKRAGQISGLENLSKSGNFNIGDVEKVLGNLKVDSGTFQKLARLQLSEQEAIAKEIVARNLSAAEIEKEIINTKTYNSSLLNVGRTLNRLIAGGNFSFETQNIRNAGARQIAISGASQSLGSLGEFLAPETRNRFENNIKNAELRNETTGNQSKIATDFIAGLDKFPDDIAAAFKKYESDDKGENETVFGRGDKLQSQLRSVILNSVNPAGNPIDVVNQINKNLNNLDKELGGAGGKDNSRERQAIKDYVNNNLNVPVQLERTRDEQRKALQENTNRLNELNISLSKKINFFGGGGFEATNGLDFGKINAGLGAGQSIRNNLTNPFNNRIFKSRGNSFDDFFKGRPINENAETARNSQVFSTLAAGRLQAYQLGLFQDNPGAINETRGLVSRANEESIKNQRNKLLISGQNSGDISFVDTIRGVSSGRIKETANLNALKQVPLDEKTRSGLDNQLGGINQLLQNPNLPEGLRNQLTAGRSKIENQLGPDGVFKELNSELENLNINLKTGIQGNFQELIDSSKKAAGSLNDLIAVISLRIKGIGENEANLNIQNLTKKRTFDANEILKLTGIDTDANLTKSKKLSDILNSNRPNPELFARILDAEKTGNKLNLPSNTVTRFADLGQQYNQGKITAPDFFTQLATQIPDEKVRGKLLQEQLTTKLRPTYPNLYPNETPIQDQNRSDLINQAGILNKTVQQFGKSVNIHNPEIDKLQQKLKDLDAQLQKINPSPNSAGLIPTFGDGLLNSLLKEKKDISRGIGGARNSDHPYLAKISGVGPAVVNSGETIVKNFGGTGKDAILNRKMKEKMGWHNYADGLVDNRFNSGRGYNLLLPDFGEAPPESAEDKVFDNVAANTNRDAIQSLQISKEKKALKLGQILASELKNQVAVSSKYGSGFVTGRGFDRSTGFHKANVPLFSYNNDLDVQQRLSATGDSPTQPQISKPVSTFDSGQSIFGRTSARQSRNIFENQFVGGANYQPLNIQDRINRENNPLGGFNRNGNLGGFKNVSLQPGSGLDRPNTYRRRTPEENEAFFRRTNPAADARYRATIGTTGGTGLDSNSGPINKLSGDIDRLIETVKSWVDSQKQDKKENDPKPGENPKIDAKHEISININENINVANGAVEKIVKEEIDKANQNIKARVAALEVSNKTGQPLQAVPPTVQPAAAAPS